MALRVIGAGVGRTGTESLKLALERLLGAPCYHMLEVLEHHPEHVELWRGATAGAMPDWEALFDGYAAAVDWPAASFWPELTVAFPDAVVLLSFRDADDWFRSASRTIFALPESIEGDDEPARLHSMASNVLRTRFAENFREESEAVAAFERHNAAVRAAIPRDRLVEWRTGDGWEPLCTALGLPLPDEPFPHANVGDDFQAKIRELPGGRSLLGETP